MHTANHWMVDFHSKSPGRFTIYLQWPSQYAGLLNPPSPLSVVWRLVASHRFEPPEQKLPAKLHLVARWLPGWWLGD